MPHQCPRHPSAPATDLCVECGDFVCAECATVLADRRVVCPKCKESAAAPAKPPAYSEARSEPRPPPSSYAPAITLEPAQVAATPSPKAIIALVLGFVGCACLPLSIVGLVLAYQEKAAVAQGKSATSSGLITAALMVNYISLALSALIFLLSVIGSATK